MNICCEYYLHTERFYGDFVKIDNSRWRVYHPTGHVDITSQGVQTWMYYVRDRLGSTRVVISAQGVPLQAFDYYPSGIPVETYSAGNAYNTTDRLHTGKEFHAFDGVVVPRQRRPLKKNTSKTQIAYIIKLINEQLGN